MDWRFGNYRLNVWWHRATRQVGAAFQITDGWKPPCYYDIAKVEFNPRFLRKEWRREQQRNKAKQKIVGLRGAGLVS